MRQFFVRQLVASPQVGDACVGCGICAQNCPMQTIRMEGRRAVINLSNCIRCYCCHELCPEKAITLKQSWVQRLVR
jgi:formate hydrogenlyase subunit 6/NADH:ubiquinone oxidoreductase subunit I